MKRSLFYSTSWAVFLATFTPSAEASTPKHHLRGKTPLLKAHTRRTTVISDYDLTLGSMAVALAHDESEEGRFPAQWAEEYGNDLPHPHLLQIQQGAESAFWSWSLQRKTGASSSKEEREGEWVVHGSWSTETRDDELETEQKSEPDLSSSSDKKEIDLPWNPHDVTQGHSPSYMESNFFGQGQHLIVKLLEADELDPQEQHDESVSTPTTAASLLLCVCNSPETHAESCDCSGM